MPSERRSARRALACHRACSTVADKFACETLCQTLCHGRVSEWTGRLRCAHHTRGMARLVRFGRREGRTRAARLERRRTSEQHARWTCRRRTTCFGAESGSRCFHTALTRAKHISLLELESLISLLRRVTREGLRARRLLVLVDSRHVEKETQQVTNVDDDDDDTPMLTLSSPALRSKSRVGSFEKARETDVRMYHLGDAPTKASKREYTAASVRKLPHEDEKKQLGDEKTENEVKRAADCSHTSCWPCHDPIIILLEDRSRPGCQSPHSQTGAGFLSPTWKKKVKNRRMKRKMREKMES